MNDMLNKYVEYIDKINDSFSSLLSNDTKNKKILDDIKNYSSKLKTAINSKQNEIKAKTITNNSTASSELGGTKAKLSYSQMTNIYEYMNESLKSLRTAYQNVETIYNERDSWQGEAATRYFDKLKNNISPMDDNILNINKMPLTIDLINKSIEENKKVDSKIISDNITIASIDSKIGAATSVSVGHSINEELNNSVKTNSNIQGNSVTTNAYSVNDELNNSVQANGNIQGNSITTEAHSVNQELNNSVGVNGNVSEAILNSSYFDSRELPELKIDSIFKNDVNNSSLDINNEVKETINKIKNN